MDGEVAMDGVAVEAGKGIVRVGQSRWKRPQHLGPQEQSRW